ncbi:MAG: hypothetical protein JXK05_11840 [Campylobacterales bacterium]|nr:hypothetical protein [Campylobacterales bacterium]
MYRYVVAAAAALTLLGCGGGGSSGGSGESLSAQSVSSVSVVSSSAPAESITSSAQSSASSIRPDMPPLPSSSSSSVPAVSLRIDIDTSRSIGDYHSFTGVNKSPLFAQGKEENSTLIDGRELYRFAGIDEVRMHDDRIDICKIFTADRVVELNTNQVINGCTYQGGGPFRLQWSAEGDVTSLANYDFSEADRHAEAIEAIGATLYLRLGDSYNGINDASSAADYAYAAKVIYEHYAAKTPLSAVEIHNEPDGMFWQGSLKTFFDFSNTLIGHLIASPYAIGGSGFTDHIVKNIDANQSLVTEWFEKVDTAELDFYSAHYYGDCESTPLSDYLTWAQTLRAQIDARGFAGKPMHISEYNIGLGQECGASVYTLPRSFSFTLGMMMLSQEEALDIDKLFYYAGPGNSMSLLSIVEGQNRITINPAYWSFYLSSRLKGAQRLKTRICGDEGCKENMARVNEGVLAQGVSLEGKHYLLLLNDTPATLSYEGFFADSQSATATLERFAPQNDLPLELTRQEDLLVHASDAPQKALDAIRSTEAIEITQGRFTATIEAYSAHLISIP